MIVPLGCSGKIRTSGVYFLGAGSLVKIGASDHIERRIKQVQTTCPYDVRLLATSGGDRTEEARLHRRFAPYRVRGEWFRHEGALATYIAGIA